MATNLPPLPEVEHISDSPRIIRILGGNPSKFTLQGTNTYLLGTGPTRTLIDTAQGLPSWSSALSRVLSNEKCTISTVLLTHWHPDHIGGIPHLLSTLSPQPEIYKNDPAYLGGSRTSEPSNSSSASSEAAAMVRKLGGIGVLRQELWRPIDDDQAFDVPGESYKLRALHTPGHTTDHMSFLLLSATQGPDDTHKGVHGMFTGDNVLGHGTAVFEDLDAYIRSLHRMGTSIATPAPSAPGDAQTEVVDTPLYPGHGAVVPKGQQKITEYVQHRAQREREVLEALEKGGQHGKGEGMTSMEVVKIVYRDVDERLHAPAKGGVRLVLEKLRGEGRVRSVEGEKWVVEMRTGEVGERVALGGGSSL